jgi:branched-chain amino acid transport system ATP-binding protein
MLEIQGLTVKYGGLTALEDVSLHVAEAELVAVVGANGAGKSTLFKALSGTVKPLHGHIIFLGEDLARVSPPERARMGIAHVPEGRRVFAPMTVEENLRVGAMSRRRYRSELDSVYALFPVLKDKRAQQAGQLSGGQQQMLAMGRALMSRPRLLLLDEPSMGLAPAITEMIFDRLRVVNELGVAALLVEQRADEACDVADRGYVLDRGRVVVSGSGQQLATDDRVRAAYLGT